MSISEPFKKILIAAAIIASIVALFLIHSLAGLTSRPVVFAEPPGFVEQYATTMHPAHQHGLQDSGASGNLTKDFAAEEALVRQVFFEDDSPQEMLRLFAHPDRAQRVKIAAAFAHVNIVYTHDEESGFPPKRNQFWEDHKVHLPVIENALSEALIATAQENTQNYIPYTLAWIPGQDHKTVELLTWAAKHHPDPWVRRFSVYFVVAFGENETYATELLEDRVDDPAYMVRKQVLDLKVRRIFG